MTHALSARYAGAVVGVGRAPTLAGVRPPAHGVRGRGGLLQPGVDLGNRDQQVDEEDDRTAGIQQELEDEIGGEGRGDDTQEPDDR